MKPLTIRQTEYALSANKNRDLVTRSILVCTAVFGVDKNTGVAFLAHFDLPCTAGSLKNDCQRSNRNIRK